MQTNTATLPWFRQPRMASGEHVVTWFVPVKNRRGTVALDARSSSYTNLDDALADAADLAHARFATVRTGREEVARFERGGAA